MERDIIKAEVVLIGDCYKVDWVYPSEDILLAPGKEYINVNPGVASKLREYLSAGNEVTIKKDIVDKSKQEAFDLSVDNFEVEELGKFEKHKKMVSSKVEDFFSHSIATTSALKFFMFFTTNSILADAGYFVTTDNREEKYLEIINSEDEKLISALESYLEAKEDLELCLTIYKSYMEYKEKIEDAKTIEEIDEAAKGLLEVSND